MSKQHGRGAGRRSGTISGLAEQPADRRMLQHRVPLRRILVAVSLLAGSPACPADPAPSRIDSESGLWLYRIHPGDTLIGITRRHLVAGTHWRRLQALNRVRDPRRLMPGSNLQIPVDWLRRVDSDAEVIHVRGDARRIEAGGSTPLAVGDRLRPADVVDTAADATATLRFADGSRLLVAPGSRIVLDRMQRHDESRQVDSHVRIERGEADSRVEPQTSRRRGFRVITPTIHLGVRGTEFRTRAEEGVSRAEVIDGIVAVTNGPRALGAGFGVVARAGERPSPPQPLVAAPRLETLPERLERIPLRFAWDPVAGATAYRAQVFPPDAPDRLLLDGRFAEPVARWADLPDGRYELRVRAVDAAGLEGLDGRRAFVLKARPEPPFIQSPTPGARLHGERVMLRWARVASVERYRLQVTDLAAATAVVERDDLTGGEVDVALPPGEYLWRVASVAAGNDLGPFGDAQAFVLRPIPQAPATEPPEVADDGLVLRWRAGEPGQRYELQLARDAGFTDVVQELSTEQPVARLGRPPAGRYHLRMRTIDVDGFVGPYGQTQQVEVPRPRGWWLLPASLLLLLIAL